MKSFLRSFSTIVLGFNLIFLVWMAGCGTEAGNPDTSRSEEKTAQNAENPMPESKKTNTSQSDVPSQIEVPSQTVPNRSEVGANLPGDPGNQSSPVAVDVTPTPLPSDDL